LALGFGHHVEHLIRGVYGWPFNSEVNPFTISLVVYPIVLLGFELTRRGKVGAPFWAVVTLASALAIGIIHLTPFGPEPPGSLFDEYESALAASIALAIVLAAVVVLITAAAYATRLWASGRRKTLGDKGGP
jgi:hypothetical protein